ncbi:nitrous oxide reductase accessory protein NosL [Halarcobacter sp.]|uniref:nitrous oxide reductase accessory protein NosL n=1 Tax=Halarcobacter sp. TaxID=2321133 RepID=UPI002AA939C2|nr:nitrous oxide reductase accessory protein NosL [Halarcobacter sp.]
MKKMAMFLLSILAISITLNASDMKKPKMAYQAVPAQKATLVQKGEEKNYCPICGMTLPMFYKTNHAAKAGDTHKQYCSIHCMVEDIELNGAKLTDMSVVDNKSLKFISVKDAFYVVGSSKPGTMTMTSKYAFKDKADALAFQKENGGEIKSFDEIYAIVAKGLEKEKAMIAAKQAKMQKMGEKVYNKMCKKTDMTFDSTAQAKAYVAKNQLCGNMKGKKLQAVGIYLSRR